MRRRRKAPPQSMLDESSLVFDVPITGSALGRAVRLVPRAFRYMRPFRLKTVCLGFVTVAAAALALAEPWPLAFVVDVVLQGESPPAWVDDLVGDGTTPLILFAVGVILIVTLLAGATMVLQDYLSTNVDLRMGLDFRSDLLQHVQRLSLAYHDDARTGVLMYRVNQQAVSVGSMVVSLPILARYVLTIVGMAYVAYRINPTVALVALLVVPLISYSTIYYTNHIEPQLIEVRAMEGMNLAIVHEALSMLRVIVAFGRERHHFDRFRRQGEATVDMRVNLTVRQTFFKLAVNLITAAGTAAVLGVGAYQVLSDRMSVGELLVVMSYIAAVYVPLEQLSTQMTAFQQQMISFEHALQILDTPLDVKEKPDPVDIGRVRGDIVVDGVGFDYPRRPGTLRDVSLHVPAGQAVAIVGPTGAGKSTLVSLIPRFYDPTAGRVVIDGHDVRDVSLASLRAQFSIVLQEPLLFEGSIVDNIRYGRPDATFEEIWQAAKAANAHDFIMKLPDQYATILGERGTKISGGERQRIAVARAFLRDAPILILDEPTSSIDSRTEGVILEALERLMEGRTTILIAHRLSTVRAVDQIVVLNEGRIVERGTHQELNSADGLYRQLWAAQSGAAPAVEPASKSTTLDEIDPESGPAHQELGKSVVGAAGPASISRPKIVLLGTLSTTPASEMAWLLGQYAVGFDRLGCETYYVEAHGRVPLGDGGWERAADRVRRVMTRFGLAHRWAIDTREGDRTLGMTRSELDHLYRDAALILNVDGATSPLDEHLHAGTLAYLGTDPLDFHVALRAGDSRARELFAAHDAHFTWAINHGNADCRLPWSPDHPMVPSPPPVVADLWEGVDVAADAPFTTIASWRHGLNKHLEFLKLRDLPELFPERRLELALAGDDDTDVLEAGGWSVRDAETLFADLDAFRDFIWDARGEITVATDQDVRFRSGWIGARSAAYLAAGRPVVMQDTGVGSALPTGAGLLTFTTTPEAAEALRRIDGDYATHRQRAIEVARDHLAHDTVLPAMLDHVGVGVPQRSRRRRVRSDLPHTLALTPLSRRPLQLPPATLWHVSARPVPRVPRPAGGPVATVIIVALNNLALTRMAVESVLANTEAPPYELIVVDNGSSDDTSHYLSVLAARNPHVRTLRNDENRGFAAANNQALEVARGDVLVLLNNDAIVTPGWLARLGGHLDDPAVGLVGPVTNRCGNEAEIDVTYDTYGEMLGIARDRAGAGALTDIPTAVMFCVAMRRDTYERVGALDERFELGLFEDDDYATRVRAAGLRVVCAEDTFVHHFGEGTLGWLAAAGRYGELFEANRRRFEAKWGVVWEPHGRRVEPAYEELRRRTRDVIEDHVPVGSVVLVVSRGDDTLVDLPRHRARHFPRSTDGRYAGHHPADDGEAIELLEQQRASGASHLVLPATALWWLDHYQGFAEHLATRYRRHAGGPGGAVVYELSDQEMEVTRAAG